MTRFTSLMLSLAATSLLLLSMTPASLTFVRADDEGPPGDVIVLTNDNFDETVNKEPLILVEFYAPWCGHCKALAPEYKEAATALLELDPPVPLAKLDATKHSETSGRFGVSGYPTLKLFRHGKVSDYTGPRKAPGIIQYMKKQVGPAMRPLATVEDVEAFKKADKENKFVVVGFFSGTSRLASSFMLTANKMRDQFVFGKVTNADVLAHYKIEKEGLVAFKGFDDKVTRYEGDSKTKNVESWIKQNSVPLLGVFKESNAERYYNKKMPLLKLYMPLTKRGLKEKAAKYYVNRIKPAATEYREHLLTVVASASKFNDDMKGFGAETDDMLLVIEDVPNNKKYHFEDQKFTAENVNKFVAAWRAGELPVHVKSEKVVDNKGKAVSVIVGKNFEDIVINNDDEDIFIEFYAPWCGHCKALEPKWEELGRKLKKHRKAIRIAKIDGTNNDYPRETFEVSGFPTIFLKKAGKQSVKKYEGAREVNDMYSWLKKNSKKLKKSIKKAKKDGK